MRKPFFVLRFILERLDAMDQSITDLNVAADAIIAKLNAVEAALEAALVAASQPPAPPAVTPADVQAVTDKLNAADTAVPAPTGAGAGTATA